MGCSHPEDFLLLKARGNWWGWRFITQVHGKIERGVGFSCSL